MARIFISYKRVDKDKVFKIKDQIESALGEKCWIDLDGIESDALFEDVIIRNINESEVVLFMYSKAHTKITDFENDWTIRELSFAREQKKRVVFVNIDGSTLTDKFKFRYSGKQQIDGTSTDSMSRLIDDMAKWLSVSVPLHPDYTENPNTCKLSPIVRGCIIMQVILYAVFAIASLWLFMYKPIPYTQGSRILNAIVILFFLLSLYSTLCLLKLKRWAFWSILTLDVLNVILISWISTNMTGKVLCNELLRQLHGYGRAINFGKGGFFFCMEFLFGIGLHSFVTYLVLLIRYKGNRAWDLMK